MSPTARGPVSVVRLYDPESGRQVNEPMVSKNAEVIALAFDPVHRNWLLGMSDGKLRMVGRGVTVEAHTGAVQAVAFSPDGRLLATAHDRTVRFWNPRNGEAVGEVTAGARVCALAVEPDGALLAIVPAMDGTSPTGTEIVRIDGLRGRAMLDT
jgi:WD40 repeat protein